MSGPEFTTTEKPFLDQLALMGWKVVTGNIDEPSVTGRDSFREVLLKGDLKKAMRRINTRDGRPWLDDDRISQAISALDRITAPRLMEANEEATELLLKGTTVAGLDNWDNGRDPTVHFIDWEHPENNAFLAINQFRVDCPKGQAKTFFAPDITLFINGIPVGVVECKSPAVQEPVPAAVNQLRRYSNQRKYDGEVDDNEGNEKLFFTNQLLIATSYDEARVGSIGASLAHYLEWKDTAPVALNAVKAELNKATLSSQNRLVAGMLRKEHLLDIIRHFTLFKTQEGRRIKIVPRYQQFRAVCAATNRLLTGKTRKEDGEHDRRGGICFHTQGSGKSLTMVFLIRKMRSIPELRRFKVVVVTDRKSLQKQLSDDMAATTGETVRVAKRARDVKPLLSRTSPDIIFAMIQKYSDHDVIPGTASTAPNGNVTASAGGNAAKTTPRAATKAPEKNLSKKPLAKKKKNEKAESQFPVLNEDDAILVMVDEAHRSHSNALHASLLKALPNAARIGFTGTPIIMGQKKRTHTIFGEFIDRYTLKEAEEDGATVPILYEGRTADGAISEGRDLDQLFEDLFSEKTEEELEAIKRKYGTKGAIFEAEKLIEAKAKDMLAHYVEHILPNGLKAQVVAYSRLAAVRYYDAFNRAREELVKDAEALDDATRSLEFEALEDKPRKTRVAVRAWHEIDVLRTLEFAPIISPDNNDDPAFKEWTDASKIETRIERFKRPLKVDGKTGHAIKGKADSGKTDPLAFIIVKSMLLTGFDAPIEGVMYLDRTTREAELLQAIARVNRTGHGKRAGIVVDYYGVAKHLKEALSAYSEDDIEGALQSMADEIPKLRDRHHRVMDMFKSRGLEIHGEENKEECVLALSDEKFRAEFGVKLKMFLSTLDVVLPRPEALDFVADAKALGEIYARARNLYRDGRPTIGKDVGGKVRKLIDDHVVSLGIDPKIPPIAITDAKFEENVDKQRSPRAQASEMEHAARHHIRKHLDEDPVYYQKLSERLEELLKKFGKDWEQLAAALREFVKDVHAGRKADETGLDPVLEAPFFAVLKEEREKEAPVTSGADRQWLTDLTRSLLQLLRSEATTVGFWSNAHRQEEVRGHIFGLLNDADIVDFDRLDEVADRLMEMAKANASKLNAPGFGDDQ